MPKYMLNKYYNVKDAEATKVFGKGEKREDYADAWQDTGNAILVGLPGSGKMALAELLAHRTGMSIKMPSCADDAVAVLKGTGSIIVLGDALVQDPSVQPLIHGAGKVFYLMVDSNTLAARIAARDGVEDKENLWRDMSARLAMLEPTFYSVLHFILQGVLTPEELVEDALEKISF